MLTEPWIVDPVSMAPRMNTSPQPVESKSKTRGRTGERRCVTNHPATELYPCSRRFTLARRVYSLPMNGIPQLELTVEQRKITAQLGRIGGQTRAKKPHRQEAPRDRARGFKSRGKETNARSEGEEGRARPEMTWKHRTPEQWMRIGFNALVLVGVICTLLIAVARLR